MYLNCNVNGFSEAGTPRAPYAVWNPIYPTQPSPESVHRNWLFQRKTGKITSWSGRLSDLTPGSVLTGPSGFSSFATNDAMVFQSGLGAPPPSLSDRLTSTVEKGIGAGIALAAVAVVGYLIFNYHTTKKLL